MRKDLIRKDKCFLTNIKTIFMSLNTLIIKLDNLNKKEKLLTYVGLLKIWSLFSKKIGRAHV